MWEEYLDRATSRIVNKYHRRRVAATLRHQLLEIRAELIAAGVESQRALNLAMQRLGDPDRLAESVAVPDRQQRGWLFLISVAQLVFGIGLLVVSVRTEFFAALALGRVVTLWGIISTAVHTLTQNGLKHNLALLRARWRFWLHTTGWRDFAKMVGAGALGGVLAAFLGSLPWSLVTTNMFHPVMLSEAMFLVLVVLAAWGPWIGFKRRIGQAFFSVTLQAWASLSATASYLALISWHSGLVPPPLFNWDPALFVAGSWMFNFSALRSLTFVLAVKERLPWADHQIRVS